jgi:hypothetical protein
MFLLQVASPTQQNSPLHAARSWRCKPYHHRVVAWQATVALHQDQDGADTAALAAQMQACSYCSKPWKPVIIRKAGCTHCITKVHLAAACSVQGQPLARVCYHVSPESLTYMMPKPSQGGADGKMLIWPRCVAGMQLMLQQATSEMYNH